MTETLNSALQEVAVSDADRVTLIWHRIIGAKYAGKYPFPGEVLDVAPSFVAELEWLVEQAREGLRLRRLFDLVNAPGTVIEPAKLSRGRVCVVDGRTGLDACERTAEDAIETLLAEAEGEGSPSRVFLTIGNDGLPRIGLSEAPKPEAIRAAIEAATTRIA